MSIEAILENYMNNPKWEGKIFMEDEKTCYKDGFNDGVNSCLERVEQLKAQIKKLSYAKTLLRDIYICREDPCFQELINEAGYHLSTTFAEQSEDEEQSLQNSEVFNFEGAEFGYNKANEWHFVKDGDLPKENQLVLLYRENPSGANVALTHWYKSYVNDKVIAWKEIIFPNESE